MFPIVRIVATWLALSLPVLALAQPAGGAPRLSSIGESCRETSQCEQGLVCRDGTCHDEKENAPCTATADCGAVLVCVDNRCITKAAAAQGPENRLWSGRHVATGGVIGIGPALPDGGDVDGTFLVGVRTAVLWGHFELSVELAMWIPTFDYGDPILSVTTGIAGLFAITEHLYWPVRLRLGVVALNTPNDDVYTVLGGDVIGLGYRFDSGWMFEVDVPSYRYVGDFDKFNEWSWPITFTLSRVF